MHGERPCPCGTTAKTRKDERGVIGSLNVKEAIPLETGMARVDAKQLENSAIVEDLKRALDAEATS